MTQLFESDEICMQCFQCEPSGFLVEPAEPALEPGVYVSHPLYGAGAVVQADKVLAKVRFQYGTNVVKVCELCR